MNWYVLHIRTGREQEIKRELCLQGYTASAAPEKILTERANGKWVSRLRPVFPGYVFVRLDLTDADYYRITDIPGVIRFLGVGRPEPLTSDEAEFIIWLDHEGAPLEASDIVLRPGQPAKVMSGPLKGREGLIIRINRRQRRAVLAISMGGTQKEFSLSINVLRAPEDLYFNDPV